MRERRRRIGVLGGTFDPIHIGHLVIAEEARVRHRLDRIIFVPAKIPPHKQERSYSAAPHRLWMVALAIQDNPCFEVSRVDLDRQGPSFTVDTLRVLGAEYGDEAELYFVMGVDMLASLDMWHRPEDVIRLARIIAVSRPNHSVDMEALDERLPGIIRATDILETVHIGISSSDLRERVGLGLPIRYQVPACVEAYIRAHKLYLSG